MYGFQTVRATADAVEMLVYLTHGVLSVGKWYAVVKLDVKNGLNSSKEGWIKAALTKGVFRLLARLINSYLSEKFL